MYGTQNCSRNSDIPIMPQTDSSWPHPSALTLLLPISACFCLFLLIFACNYSCQQHERIFANPSARFRFLSLPCQTTPPRTPQHVELARASPPAPTFSPPSCFCLLPAHFCHLHFCRIALLFPAPPIEQAISSAKMPSPRQHRPAGSHMRWQPV